jgi:TIR domain
MADIFISYRREGTDKGRALHLAQDLRGAFGQASVFLDEQSFALGKLDDFLAPQLWVCRALIVVIGQVWKERCKDLSNATDWVRGEITAALRRDVLIVPVLVDGASMPKKSDLPDSLAGFFAYKEVSIYPQHWKENVDALIDGLATRLRLERKSIIGDVPNLSGDWIDTDGVQVKLAHRGDEVKIYLLSGGRTMGEGDATLDGHRVRLTIWRPDLGNGTGTGTVSPDGRQISGAIQYGSQRYGFSISRRS